MIETREFVFISAYLTSLQETIEAQIAPFLDDTSFPFPRRAIDERTLAPDGRRRTRITIPSRLKAITRNTSSGRASSISPRCLRLSTFRPFFSIRCRSCSTTSTSCCECTAYSQNLFDDLRALTRYMYFDSWDHLPTFMLGG